MNIFSLSLALEKSVSPFILIESDTIFDDKCFEIFSQHFKEGQSIWYTNGSFNKKRTGALKANDRRKITDIRIVLKNHNKYKHYKKLANVLMVGPEEVSFYSKLLFEACKINIKQYYHIPWIEHLPALKCYEFDLQGYKIASFNTPTEYYEALDLFSKKPGSSTQT